MRQNTVRQVGHLLRVEAVEANQDAMQWAWKAWLHGGVRTTDKSLALSESESEVEGVEEFEEEVKLRWQIVQMVPASRTEIIALRMRVWAM
jgi:hypothetical protein